MQKLHDNTMKSSTEKQSSSAIIVHEAKRTATSTRTIYTRYNKPYRLGNLGKSSTMKARLPEEVRLVEIAQGTRVRYTEMGVFSAVAGNQ